MSKPAVIIIGAGAAGLMAANELSGKFNVTILEAHPYIGGRIHSIPHKDRIIEAGAEFIHGNLPVTLGILKKAGINYIEVSGHMYRKKNDRLTKVEEMTEGWDGLMMKMQHLEEDMTLQHFLDKHYPGPANDALSKHVCGYAAGFDLADPVRVSVKALYKEWSAGEEDNFRIPAGYAALANYLDKEARAKGAIVCTGTPVKEVRWKEGAVIVYSITGEQFTAEKLLLTVPAGPFQQIGAEAHINFTPVIQQHLESAAELGFGAVIKVILTFKETFWPRDAGFVLSDEVFPTWWTQLPDRSPVLTGWLGGPRALTMVDESDEALVETALACLANIFDKPMDELRTNLEDAYVFNWQKVKYISGGYSYPTLRSADAIKVIYTPLAQTVFFAGEALYKGDHPGTVEAALASGMKAAAMVIRSMQE